MSDTIHIVCLDAPSPPDYGGAIEMYYKIVALASIGKKINLHYFSYKNDRGTKGLEQYCNQIYNYKRKTGLKGLSPHLPYIVKSRINKELIYNLNKDDHPIILEGVHTTGIIAFIKDKKRKIMVRLHNDEAAYYDALYKTETNFFKTLYYKWESILLKKYQLTLNNKCSYACIAQTDVSIFKEKYGLEDVHFVPSLIPWQQISSIEGKGTYCLYHGNLSVAENITAVEWLIKNVFAILKVPFIIGGKNPSPHIYKLIKGHPHIQIIASPDEAALNDLILNAHIHVIPSFNQTGVKLKLLNVLLNGRFCITNVAGIDGSEITEGIIIADSAADFRNAIEQTFLKPFVAQDIEQRAFILKTYNNRNNAQKLNELL